ACASAPERAQGEELVRGRSVARRTACGRLGNGGPRRRLRTQASIRRRVTAVDVPHRSSCLSTLGNSYRASGRSRPGRGQYIRKYKWMLAPSDDGTACAEPLGPSSRQATGQEGDGRAAPTFP